MTDDMERDDYLDRLRKAEAERDALKAADERVRAIHTPEQYHDELQPWCTYCNRDDNTRDDVVLWPCPTIAALDASGGTESASEARAATRLVRCIRHSKAWSGNWEMFQDCPDCRVVPIAPETPGEG